MLLAGGCSSPNFFPPATVEPLTFLYSSSMSTAIKSCQKSGSGRSHHKPCKKIHLKSTLKKNNPGTQNLSRSEKKVAWTFKHHPWWHGGGVAVAVGAPKPKSKVNNRAKCLAISQVIGAKL